MYCIIANAPPAGSKGFEAFANYSFFLDGEFVDTYTHDVEQRTDFLYNVPVYINRTMTNEPHNFIIRMENKKPIEGFDTSFLRLKEGKTLD